MISDEEFTKLYKHNVKRLQSYLTGVLGDRAVAEELVQESFVRFFSHAPDHLSEQQQRSYLYRTASHLVTDRFRKNAAHRRWWQLRPEPPPPPQPSSTAGSALGHAFNGIPVKQRKLLWLAYVEEYSHREIAEILDVGERSVRVLLHRARRRLESSLAATKDPAEECS